MNGRNEISRGPAGTPSESRGVAGHRHGRARAAACRRVPGLVLCLAAGLGCSPAVAEGLSPGPVIAGFGPVADMPSSAFNLVPGVKYRLIFDAAYGDKNTHELNRRLESAARFINMHARAGIDPKDLEIEIVTHGGTTWDVLSDAAYRKRFGRDNPNSGLLEALGKAGVSIRQCGQSLAFHGLAAEDLAPQVSVAVSAMTVLVRRQAEGWALLP